MFPKRIINLATDTVQGTCQLLKTEGSSVRIKKRMVLFSYFMSLQKLPVLSLSENISIKTCTFLFSLTHFLSAFYVSGYLIRKWIQMRSEILF